MAGYTRTDTTNNIADGNVISAADLDNEFDAIQAAFNLSSGHNHDGTLGEGAPILAVGPSQDVVVGSTSVRPKTTNVVDLGTPSLKFKDLNLSGNAAIAGTINGTTIPDTKTLVSTTDTQTLTNKTLNGSSNTFSNISLSSAVTGTLPIANGGTGATSRQDAMDALAGATTSGQYLRGNGTDVVMSAIQAGDVPTLNQNTTGTAANVTGTVAIANGGTGATSRQDAMDALAGAVTSGQYLRGNGTDVVMSAIQAADVPTLNQNTTGTASNVTGTVVVANGGTGATSLTANNVILGNGTSAVQVVAPGTNGNVLTSNGTTWTSAAPQVTLTGTQTLTNKTISGSDNTLTVDGTNAVGFRTIPQNSQSAAYTAVLSDSGKQIFHPSADTTARTFTIPANSSVAYPIGTALTFINQNGAGVVTIAITTDTMRLAGAGTTGSRTLAANGVATAIKITSTEWIISGAGLT